jgi:hypothetical protein
MRVGNWKVIDKLVYTKLFVHVEMHTFPNMDFLRGGVKGWLMLPKNVLFVVNH